jgi:hypothetical protein
MNNDSDSFRMEAREPSQFTAVNYCARMTHGLVDSLLNDTTYCMKKTLGLASVMFPKCNAAPRGFGVESCSSKILSKCK